MTPDTELARPSRFDALVLDRICDPAPQTTRAYYGVNHGENVQNHRLCSFEWSLWSH